MQLTKGSADSLRESGLMPTEVKRVLTRLESAAPHLRFAPWSATRLTSGAERSESTWTDESRLTVNVQVILPSLRLSSTCERDQDAVSLDDRHILGHLAAETERVLRTAGTGMVSLIDYGTQAVAAELGTRADLQFNPLPVLQFIRSLSHETYENRSLSYGIILSRSLDGRAPFHEALDNKRIKRITDGISTALVIDRKGKVVELAPLHSPQHESLAARRRPWSSAGLAEAAKAREAVGVALTHQGDMVIVDRGRLVFSQRAGVWRVWNHPAILARLKSLWDFCGPAGQLSTVLSHFYQLAMDLAFNRTGGLLIVLGGRNRLDDTLASRADRINSASRSGPERALDRSLLRRSVQKTDRRIANDLASLDGALIVDRSGRILAYGAMVKLGSSAKQGARTRAALGASHNGIAIMISADGNIGFYRAGELHFEI